MATARASDDTALHYQLFGRRGAPPLLLVAGLGEDLTGWTLQRIGLGRHYRTIAFDNRGVGRSGKPAGPLSLEQMADDAMAVLDTAGVESAHVMGLSLGGTISQFIAVRHPARVRSLTLVCTACRNHPWRTELLNHWAAKARDEGMGALGRDAMRWLVGPRSLRRYSPALGFMGPFAMHCSTEAFVAQIEAILAIDSHAADALAAVSVPTLVVGGNQDILTPRGDAEELAERISGAELVMISGAAHGLTVEHAHTFNRIAADFLARSEASWQAVRTFV
jgi:pimeloyl-ACP methyl ester carboxylesterase